jgi:chaperonin GroES
MNVSKMLGDWIAAEDVDVETVTGAGLHVTASKTSLCVARVIHVGAGRRLTSGEVMPMRVNVGDHVVYNAEMANEWPVPGSKLLVFQEAAVCAVVEP